MMISKTMADALNEQVKNEYASYWLYQQMAFTFEAWNLKAFAKWFTMQAEEEKEHAEKIAAYILEQGGEVVLTSLEAPKADFKSAKEILNETVEHEKKVTKMIHNLVDLANKENDHATRQMLQWFVQEQVEEVASTSELSDMVALIEQPSQLLMFESRVWRMVEERD